MQTDADDLRGFLFAGTKVGLDGICHRLACATCNQLASLARLRAFAGDCIPTGRQKGIDLCIE